MKETEGMKKIQSTAGVTFFLFMLFLIGIGLNVFIILDAEVLHWLIGADEISAPLSRQKDAAPKTTKPFASWEEAKKSILLVIPADCNGKACGSGTGFVVKPGYVATNAHVVKCGVACEKFVLRDYKGVNHEAKLEAIASGQRSEDLAILSVSGLSLPPLPLANSAEYEAEHDGEEVVTIGYPLPGIASTADKSSVSGKGTISTFKSDEGIFIASGMNLNSGNSGGPVFIVENRKVLGLAVGVLRGEVSPGNAPVEGVDYVIPINRLKTFFLEKTGTDLQ